MDITFLRGQKTFHFLSPMSILGQLLKSIFVSFAKTFTDVRVADHMPCWMVYHPTPCVQSMLTASKPGTAQYLTILTPSQYATNVIFSLLQVLKVLRGKVSHFVACSKFDHKISSIWGQ